MVNPRFKFDERYFKPGQRQAALLLVEYEFTPRKERQKTKDQIAEEVGVTRMQLHRWDTQDENFIAYKNHLASGFIDSQLPLVFSKLVEGIRNGSMKGIELYLKRMGELNDKSEVTINDKRSEVSFEDRKAALLERLGSNGDATDV
ncbi:phBC6A51 family helix-turn-helix protein [Neobacillus sp. NPDC093127]|uniref:phBC6A51 family helix-turn-helix protein n=1 Tax=Neobacillus sp. NPDC093127 TaxID=3364296 RepID=UPI003829DECD